MIVFLGWLIVSGQYGSWATPKSKSAVRRMPARPADEFYPHAALATRKQRRAVAAATAILEDVLLRPVGERLDVPYVGRAVDRQLGVEAAEAVVLRSERDIMTGREVLELDPGLPCRRKTATRGAGRDQLARRLCHLRPGLRRALGIEPGLGELLLVVVEHRRRAVERHRQHLAVVVRVVAGHGLEKGVGIERLAALRHQFVHGLDSAAGRHHRRRADLEDLHDVRLLAGPEGGDGAGHGLRVVAAVDRDDLELVLSRVERGGDGLDLLAERAAHGVPPRVWVWYGKSKSLI